MDTNSSTHIPICEGSIGEADEQQPAHTLEVELLAQMIARAIAKQVARECYLKAKAE